MWPSSSHNRRMAVAGRHLWRSLSPTSWLSAGWPKASFSGHCSTGFWKPPEMENHLPPKVVFYALFLQDVRSIFLFSLASSQLCNREEKKEKNKKKEKKWPLQKKSPERTKPQPLPCQSSNMSVLLKRILLMFLSRALMQDSQQSHLIQDCTMRKKKALETIFLKSSGIICFIFLVHFSCYC